MRFISSIVCLLFCSVAYSAPKAELIEHWNRSNEQSTQFVDHSAWQQILNIYLNDQHESGVNRFDYQKLKNNGIQELEQYLEYLQSQIPTSLSKAEQKAYWINLYNAATVHLVAKNLPVKSIKDISPYWISFGMGPWNMSLLNIEGKNISLNDIEHGILRPIWKDTLLHYGLNCASIGCPNLLKTAFTKDNTDQLLKQAASDYINHQRAVKVSGKSTLELSSIYKWYISDFGGNTEKLLQHLHKFAKPELKKNLSKPYKDFTYYYNWTLNKP